MDFNLVFALVLAPLCLGSEEDGPGADEDWVGGADYVDVDGAVSSNDLSNLFMPSSLLNEDIVGDDNVKDETLKW